MATVLPATRRRTLPLVGALAVLAVVFFVTAPYRARLQEQAWQDRLAVKWAAHEQQYRLSQRELRVALRSALRALVKDPEDTQALLAAAAAYGQLSRYDEALFCLDEALRLRPRDPKVYRARCEVFLATGKYDRCLDTVEQGLAITPDDLDLNLTRLDLDVLLGSYGESSPRVKRMLALYGAKEARVHLMAALLDRQMADARGALEELRAAKRLEPKNDKIYSILAGVEWELGHRDPALEAIEEGLRLNPSSAEYYLQLAQIQSVGFGKTAAAARQALVTYNRAAELAPSSTQARLGIAVCRIRIGDRSGQRILEELVRTHPYLPAALLELANLYNRQGRRKEANELLGRYQASVKETDELKGMTLRMSMQPKRAEGYREAGEMQLRSGNPQKAVVFFRRSLRLTPGDQQSRRDLALALTQSDRATEIPALLARP